MSSSLKPAVSRVGEYDEKWIQMSVADLQELEEIKGLVTRGQQLGVLTYAEISGAVSELDLDEADVEELHGFLERAEIELVEELDPALAAADLERAPDKRGRRGRGALVAAALRPPVRQRAEDV